MPSGVFVCVPFRVFVCLRAFKLLQAGHRLGHMRATMHSFTKFAESLEGVDAYIPDQESIEKQGLILRKAGLHKAY